ncbi:MAG: acyltransferase [Candidatus Thorarchaeota archaeon]
MRVLILNTFFLFTAAFVGFTVFEMLASSPQILRFPLALIVTYFLFVILFLLIDALCRFLLRGAPDILVPGTWHRFIWGVGYLARDNYFRLLQAWTLISGPPLLAMRLLGLKYGKRLSFIDSKMFAEPSRVSIGENVLIGSKATIGEQFHPFRGKVDRRRITIGNNCLLGGRVIVYNGVQIGDNVVVGVLSVVPAGSVLESDWLYSGVPARKIHEMNQKGIGS